MPKHVLITLAIALSLFGLIWFGVFVMEQTANEALVVSALTVVLISAGVAYTRSTLRSDRSED